MGSASKNKAFEEKVNAIIAKVRAPVFSAKPKKKRKPACRRLLQSCGHCGKRRVCLAICDGLLVLCGACRQTSIPGCDR